MHRRVVLSRVVDERGCSGNAGLVLVAPVFLSPDHNADEVVRRLVLCVVGDDGNGGGHVNRCSDVDDEMMFRSVRYAIGGSESRGDDVNEWSDVADVEGRQVVEVVLVGCEVCGDSVSGRSLLYSGLLSPDP